VATRDLVIGCLWKGTLIMLVDIAQKIRLSAFRSVGEHEYAPYLTRS
jgi:hypothetical protein